MKAAEFIKKYVEYLYDGTRCFEMDDVYENENECFEALMEQYNSDPEDICYGLEYETQFDPDAAVLLEMFNSIEKEEKTMMNNNMKWFVVDERKGCQIFIERLDVTTKEDAIKCALRDLDRLTDREKKNVTLLYVMLASDIDGDPDFESEIDACTLFRDGHPVVYVNGNEFDYNMAVILMDDEIREDLNDKLAPCTDQEFIDAYCEEHYNKYGIDFVI